MKMNEINLFHFLYLIIFFCLFYPFISHLFILMLTTSMRGPILMISYPLMAAYIPTGSYLYISNICFRVQSNAQVQIDVFFN